MDSSNNDESSQRGELQVEVPELNTGDKNISRECCFVPCFWLFFNFPQLLTCLVQLEMRYVLFLRLSCKLTVHGMHRMLTENKLDFGTLETRIIKCLFSFKHLNSGVGWFFTHLEMLPRTWLETELMVNSPLSGSVSLSLCIL